MNSYQFWRLVLFSSKQTILTIALCTLLIIFPALSSEGARSRTLIFLHYWTGSLTGGISDITDEFNRTNPDTTIRATGFEHESYKVGINVMLAGGSPPDMFSYWAGAKVQALVDKNLLVPIDDVWKEAALDQTFPPSVSAACTYDKKKYALPLTQHYVSFFYNKKIFNELNIAPPKDWESFIAACDKLKRTGITPIALGSRERWPAQFWFDYILLRTAGPTYRQKLMAGHASYLDPEVKNAFNIWRGLLNAGYFNNSANQLDWSEAAVLVRSGKAAMTLMGTWIIGLFDGKLEWAQGKEYDFFRFPVMSSDIPMTALGPIDAIVIPREGNFELAKQTLAYFSTPGPQMEMCKTSGALSPSQVLPSSIYTPLQKRILDEVHATPNWAFNYDLATPPTVAGYGLDAFKEFIKAPNTYRKILTDVDAKASQFFANKNK